MGTLPSCKRGRFGKLSCIAPRLPWPAARPKRRCEAMPTVVDPELKEQSNNPETPTYKERELFAAEIEMEKKSSSFGPLVMILVLVLAVGGTIFYFVKTSREVLTAPVATNSINQILQSQGGGKIHFSVGTIVSSVNEKPMDPHYKLLAKAGILTIKPKSWNSIYATMTPSGEKLLDGIKGVDKGKNSDGNTRSEERRV